MVTTNTIAKLGALIGDSGRANMLVALLEGRALTAGELAHRAGVTPQTASRHLSKLLDSGLLRVEAQGRHRYHRLASAEVARMLETMHVAGAAIAPVPHAQRFSPADVRMREVRTCYDHLAGRLAVQIAEAVTTPDEDGQLRLTVEGEDRLTAWGLHLSELRLEQREFCRSCLDWSERRLHLAGVIGRAMLQRGLELGWLRRRDGTRSLEITFEGRRGFGRAFGIRPMSSHPTAPDDEPRGSESSDSRSGAAPVTAPASPG